MPRKRRPARTTKKIVIVSDRQYKRMLRNIAFNKAWKKAQERL